MKPVFLQLGLISVSLCLVSCLGEPENLAIHVLAKTHVDEKLSREEMNSSERVEKQTNLNKKKWKNDELQKLSFAGVKDPQELQDFLSKIRRLAKENDRQGVAELIFYPFNTYESKGGTIKKTYKSEIEFLHDYDIIVSPSLQDTLKNANYNSFFSNWRGGAIANGAVWFNTFEGKLKITRLSTDSS